MNEWSQDEVEFIRKNRDYMTIDELSCELYNKFGTIRTRDSIRYLCHKKSITKDRRHIKTEEEVQFIRNNYGKYPEKEILIRFKNQFNKNISLETFLKYSKKMGLSFSNVDRYDGFKGGYPIGAEVYDKYKGWLIKVASKYGKHYWSNWKPKAHVIYEEKYGPIPNDHVITYLDGDNRNCTIDNIICIHKKVSAATKLNHRFNYCHPEMTKAWAKFTELDLRTKGLIEDET